MRFKPPIFLIPAVLLCATAGAAEPDATVEPEESVVLPSDRVFDSPDVTDQIEQLIRSRNSVLFPEGSQADGSADTSLSDAARAIAIRSLAEGTTVTAFRTLAEAAAAGVNPLAEPQSQFEAPTPASEAEAPPASALTGLPVIQSADQPEDKSVWPIIFASVALAIVVFLVIVVMLTLNSRSRSKPGG